MQWNGPSPIPRGAQAVRRIVERIPPAASVAVTSRVGPFAARRERLYHFPPLLFARGFYTTDLSQVDYIVVERLPGSEGPLAELEQNADFVPDIVKPSVVLYRRRVPRPAP